MTSVVNFRSTNSGKRYHIGLAKATATVHGETYWLDGNNSTYRNYDHDEPNSSNTCFFIKDNNDGKFEDGSCTVAKYYVCKLTSGSFQRTLHVICFCWECKIRQGLPSPTQKVWSGGPLCNELAPQGPVSHVKTYLFKFAIFNIQ